MSGAGVGPDRWRGFVLRLGAGGAYAIADDEDFGDLVDEDDAGEPEDAPADQAA